MGSGPPRVLSGRVPLGWNATSRPWASPGGTCTTPRATASTSWRSPCDWQGWPRASRVALPPPPRVAGHSRPPPHLCVRAH
eukprot:4741043-Alexandrium_andersonii.AAC.1